MTRLAQPLRQLLNGDFGDWQPALRAWRESAAGRSLIAAVDSRVDAGAIVFPADPFRAFRLTHLADVKVVILGQDPYHGPGQAEGLAFSVPAGQRIPPSLRNVFGEMKRDLGLPPPVSGSLLAWSARGVLLLNTVLTVEAGRPLSHARLGWQALTDAIISAAVDGAAPKVFMLWGAQAQRHAADAERRPGVHLTLCANHPSPLSALRPPVPFIGCGHFGRANQFLTAAGRGPVDWRL